MVAFRVGRSRPAQQLEVHDAELAKRAGRALVAADERIRAAADELGFAEANTGRAKPSLRRTHVCPLPRVAAWAAIQMHRLKLPAEAPPTTCCTVHK